MEVPDKVSHVFPQIQLFSQSDPNLYSCTKAELAVNTVLNSQHWEKKKKVPTTGDCRESYGLVRPMRAWVLVKQEMQSSSTLKSTSPTGQTALQAGKRSPPLDSDLEGSLACIPMANFIFSQHDTDQQEAAAVGSITFEKVIMFNYLQVLKTSFAY